MDAQTRGKLLIQKEEVDATIQRLTTNLKEVGNRLADLGNDLKHAPENVLFSGAPHDEFNHFPANLSGKQAHHWGSIPALESIAQGILDLRMAHHQSQGLQRQLEAR